MRNANGNLGKKEHVRHFLHKTCNEEVSGRFTLQKKWDARAKLLLLVFFLLIRPIVVFSPFRCLRRLALHDDLV